MTHLPIWYLQTINPEDCDKAIEELGKFESKDATMGVDGEAKSHQHRNTSVVFAPYDYWLADKMTAVAHEANAACGWDYLVEGREAIQFARYGEGQHYHWHVDTFTLAGRPTDRKITCVALLNDVSEWEGGELQLRLYQEYKAPLEKGTVIAFPSILEHRVTPVLKGFRYTATIWFNGPRFR